MALKLDPELINPTHHFMDSSNEFQATINAHGLYNTLQFVLRLSPRNHQLLSSIKPGIYRGNIDPEVVQANSTYLHETVHWWQHVGSTCGLIYSLSYLGQTHGSMKYLRNVIKTIGRKKSLKTWSYIESLKAELPTEVLGQIHVAVNNLMDVRYYKLFIQDPKKIEKYFSEPYFECIGHSYFITYGHAIGLLSTSFDENFEYLPNGPNLEAKYDEARTKKFLGCYYGSPIPSGPLGIEAIFEGQARFIQLQYLSLSTHAMFSCDDLRNEGFLSGIYIEAFEVFLKYSESEWPKKIDDPIVGLFLLICDLAINPSKGFPLDIENFGTFIGDIDPGIRFGRFCQVVKHYPQLRSLVQEYSREEYLLGARVLTEACQYDNPDKILKTINYWKANSSKMIEVMAEQEEFDYRNDNMPVRLLFSHFLSFSADKSEHPEFFCWAGAHLAGLLLSDTSENLFLKHQALYFDKENDKGIYARAIPGKSQENLDKTLRQFYSGNVLYDLTQQWVLEDGPFKYQYDWLSEKNSPEQMSNWAKDIFKVAYGADPETFEILTPPKNIRSDL